MATTKIVRLTYFMSMPNLSFTPATNTFQGNHLQTLCSATLRSCEYESEATAVLKAWLLICKQTFWRFSLF